jgi:hypothetical protein
MKILRVLVLGCCVLGCVACSDDSAAGGGAGQAGMSSGSGGAGTSQGGASASSAGARQGGASGSSAGASHAGASASAGASHAGTGGATGASDYCNMYCECHEANCASTAIPGGGACLDFCAGFPNDAQVKDCRLAMCTLVPAQPNNNHCVHSLGINECLAP